MAKDPGRSISSFVNGIKAELEKDQDAIAKAMAAEASSLIQHRTRSGRGVATDGGAAYPLKPLSPRYIAARRSMHLSAFTSASKSNLTRTSEMLGSLGIKRKAKGNWIVSLEGQHESGISNAQLARYVSRARPFMYLSGDEIEKIRNVGRKVFGTLVKRVN